MYSALDFQLHNILLDWRQRGNILVQKHVTVYMELRSCTLINPKSEFSTLLQNYLPVGTKTFFQKMFIFIVKYDAKGVILWLQNYQH